MYINFIKFSFFIIIFTFSGVFQFGHADAASARKEFNQAVKILQSRGFNKYAINSTLILFMGDHDFFDGKNMPNEDDSKSKRYWRYQIKYAKRNKIIDKFSYVNWPIIVMEYDVVTGRSYKSKNIIDFAKKVPACLKRRRPWRDCKINYHPVDGCFLTRKQVRECRKDGLFLEKKEAKSDAGISWGGSGGYCWIYERSPGVVLPFQAATKAQVDLVRATSITIGGQSEAKRKKRPIKKKKIKSTKTIKSAKTIKGKTHKKVSRIKRTSRNTLKRPICTSSLAGGPPFDPRFVQ